VTRRGSASLDFSSLQLLPFLFAAALLGGIAMQARLLPPRQIAIEIPPTLGKPPGASPQQSVPPESITTPIVAPSPVLPPESLPTDQPISPAEPSSGATALGTRRTATPMGTPSDSWVDHMPRPAAQDSSAGNINIRSKQPTAISALVASISQSLKRLYLTASLRGKALKPSPTIKPATNHAKLGSTAVAALPRNVLTGGALGGAASQPVALGGPAPRNAAAIGGVALAGAHR